MDVENGNTRAHVQKVWGVNETEIIKIFQMTLTSKSKNLYQMIIIFHRQRMKLLIIKNVQLVHYFNRGIPLRRVQESIRGCYYL